MNLPWFTAIGDLGSAAALRGRLAERHPGLANGALERLIVVGAAAEGQRLIELCRRHGVEVVAVADDNPRARETPVGGHAVGTIAELERHDHRVPVVIASHKPLSVTRRLGAMGFATVAPFMALQSLAPERFPPHAFHDRMLEDLIDNRQHYANLFTVLADDTSRHHLDALLGYRLTADIDVLEPFVDYDLYCPSGMFCFGNDEVYVDAGVFDGDSIRWFLNRVNGAFSRIIGFEPDPATFLTLRASFSDPRITLINAGLHSASQTLRFNNDASRAAALDENGAVEVAVVALDDILGGQRVSTIKMNIEGAELDALTGARHALVTWMPKLAISAYHRPTDLWRVPFHIRTLNPGYRLYLRQQDAGIIETVTYALPG